MWVVCCVRTRSELTQWNDQVNSSKSIDEVYHDISVALDSLQRRKSLSLESGMQASA